MAVLFNSPSPTRRAEALPCSAPPTSHCRPRTGFFAAVSRRLRPASSSSPRCRRRTARANSIACARHNLQACLPTFSPLLRAPRSLAEPAREKGGQGGDVRNQEQADHDDTLHRDHRTRNLEDRLSKTIGGKENVDARRRRQKAQLHVGEKNNAEMNRVHAISHSEGHD